MKHLLKVSLSLCALVLGACGTTTNAAGVKTPVATTSSIATSTTTSTAATSQALPLGDGKVTFGTSKVGYTDSCGTARTGAKKIHGGPWINTAAGTWTPSQKVAVQGSVKWPQAYYHMTVSGATRTISTDSVPVGMPTGNFPISPSDPAYQYDTNPNHIVPRALSITLPANPTAAATPHCVPMGAVGVLTNGVLLFNALDAGELDAVAHETQDSCGGHPDHFGTYHYHDIGPCLLATASGASTLVGYALDGYGIYVEHNADGSLVTNSQLDACHGRTSPVMWNGRVQSIYHYDATAAYPYVIGCFHGVVTTQAITSIGSTPSLFVQRNAG